MRREAHRAGGRGWAVLFLATIIATLSVAITSSTAQAALPEFGRCAPAKTPHSGEYTGRKCLSPAGGQGNYNWEPGPGPKPKFEGQLSKFKLETVGKKFTVECAFGVVKGEYKSAKTVSVLFELIGCLRTETGQKCQATPLKEGEMEPQFEGELGFIKAGETPKVGLELKPSSFTFSCGLPPASVTPVTVEGSAIGAIAPIDSMRESLKLSYLAPGGKQNPESFEGGVKHTLTQEWIDEAGSHSEQTGLTIIGVEEKPKPLVIENEEAIEIKAK
ncbi:MAG TPA: hypothetical protein VN672_09200 [Solirubrobacteraceae bacterium]|nr:hypothetical protein [Solirubrobacteraceae bacterium]